LPAITAFASATLTLSGLLMGVSPLIIVIFHI
jgi:hypothetical protein